MKTFRYVVTSIIAIFLMLSLNGCANSGNQTVAKLDDEVGVTQLITDGKTTRNEVIAKFGQPQEIDFGENGTLKFTYKHMRSTYKASTFIPVVGIFKSGTNDTHRHLVILFNKDNIVERHLFTLSKSETVAGLLG